jgi:hypothetical protein
MTTLPDRLADLAEDAPSGRPVPALWEQGLRYRHRRRTATAVLLAVATVALVVLGSAAWLRSPRAAEPLPAGSSGGMPDHLSYPVSEWLPGTASAGPLGPVAVLFPAARHTWTGVENAIVGVSATTGEYRFVDLPGLATRVTLPGAVPRPNWSLSPDGRYIAYGYRDGGDHLAPGAATGVALYDTSTGEVRRHALPSDWGVKASSFFWTASDTVVVVYGVLEPDGRASRESPSPLVWNVHVEGPHDLVPAVPTKKVDGHGPGFVQFGTRGGSVRVDPETGAVLRRFDHETPSGVWDASGSRAAAVADLGLASAFRGHPVVVHTLPSDGSRSGSTAGVPTPPKVFSIYSWIDDEHLAAVVNHRGPAAPNGLMVASIDVRTGQTRPLVTFASGDWTTEFATDLLARPTVPGIEPPSPLDPRLVAGLGVLIVLVAGVTLIAWRRRVRP